MKKAIKEGTAVLMFVACMVGYAAIVLLWTFYR